MGALSHTYISVPVAFVSTTHTQYVRVLRYCGPSNSFCCLLPPPVPVPAGVVMFLGLDPSAVPGLAGVRGGYPSAGAAACHLSPTPPTDPLTDTMPGSGRMEGAVLGTATGTCIALVLLGLLPGGHLPPCFEAMATVAWACLRVGEPGGEVEMMMAARPSPSAPVCGEWPSALKMLNRAPATERVGGEGRQVL